MVGIILANVWVFHLAFAASIPSIGHEESVSFRMMVGAQLLDCVSPCAIELIAVGLVSTVLECNLDRSPVLENSRSRHAPLKFNNQTKACQCILSSATTCRNATMPQHQHVHRRSVTACPAVTHPVHEVIAFQLQLIQETLKTVFQNFLLSCFSNACIMSTKM
jgi:hypothetical protein